MIKYYVPLSIKICNLGIIWSNLGQLTPAAEVPFKVITIPCYCSDICLVRSFQGSQLASALGRFLEEQFSSKQAPRQLNFHLQISAAAMSYYQDDQNLFFFF